MGKKKIFLWVPAVIFLGIVLVAYLGQYNFFGKNTATLSIKNLTPSDVLEIRVILYEDPCIIRNLKPGESENCTFQIESDSHYKISWIESSEDIYMEEAGYVTHGFNFEHELDFLGNGSIKFNIKE